MNKATTDFIEELQTDPDVVGVVLFGSWARGNNRDDSDVDLLVLLQEGYNRAVQESDGQVFEIIYSTPDAALKYYTDHRDDALVYGVAFKGIPQLCWGLRETRKPRVLNNTRGFMFIVRQFFRLAGQLLGFPLHTQWGFRMMQRRLRFQRVST